jgi:hypothetical protein
MPQDIRRCFHRLHGPTSVISRVLPSCFCAIVDAHADGCVKERGAGILFRVWVDVDDDVPGDAGDAIFDDGECG